MKMASSQLEIVSSPPLGRVPRDHKRKKRCRDSNVRRVQAVFDKNLNDLVQDHINGCISLSAPQNSQNQISHTNVASWVTNEQANAKSKSNVNANATRPSSSPVIRKQSPVLDRWVTKQSQDVTLSTIDKHGNEAAEPLLVPSRSNTASPTALTPNASAKHNLGASSLVQIWKARLNLYNSINSNQNQSQIMDSDASRTSSCVSCNENHAEESSTSDLFEEKLENLGNNGDSLTDWESQSPAGDTASPSSCSRTIDAGEIERVRIADIIQRLKTGRKIASGHEHSNNENKHCSTSDQAEHRCFSVVINTPLLRGRQAFHNLLVQINRDKIRELDSLGKRQAVSKFSQRGRIQAMLRLKSLKRCLTIQDKCRPQLPGNRFPQGSTIMHLREKFSIGAEHPMTAQTASIRCLQKEKSSICKPLKEDTHCVKGQSSEPVNRFTMNKNEDVHEQAKCPLSNTIEQKTSLEARCVEPLEIVKETTPLEGQSENEVAKEQRSNNQQHLLLGSQETGETVTQIEVAKEQRSNNQQHLLLGSQETGETETVTQIEVAKPEQEQDKLPLTIDLQETMDITTSLNSSIGNEIGDEEESGCQQHICLDSRSQDTVERSSTISYINDCNENEEEEDDYSQYFDETNDYDWFSNISRPRSYWEDLRKAWYQEVLNTTSTKEDIRQLLERRRVSTLLGSDFRESMERLLTCHVQMQADGALSQQDLDDYEEIRSRGRVSTLISSDFLEKMNRLMSSRVPIQQEDGAESRQEVQGKDEMVEQMSYQGVEEEYEDEEERSLSSNRCQEEANNNFNHSSSSLQMPSSALMIRSWSFQDDNETGNNYEQGSSGCSPPTPTQLYQAQCCPYTRQSTSSTTHPSLEMELICDLRGQIEQLQNEICELRKSFVSCMGMQMKMQNYSLNHEVHSDENSADRTTWKRSCCICHEMQVDSLLYRCGHMCTCLKCGQELQWRSGRCLICRAPILDVVPAKG